jgi:hypothetical protein
MYQIRLYHLFHHALAFRPAWFISNCFEIDLNQLKKNGKYDYTIVIVCSLLELSGETSPF